MFKEITDATTKMSKQQETIRDAQADQKVKYMELIQMKHTIVGIKILVDRLNSRSDIAEERISKLKTISEEISQN